MFGNGNFRPMMGELRLAQSYDPTQGQAPAAQPAAAPAPAAPAPALAPAPAPAVDPGMSHGTQVLIAGGLAVIAFLGVIFLTD